MKYVNVVMTAALSLNMASSQTLGTLHVNEYKLSNGLTVWLNEDHSQPKVFGAVVVKAGAKDCPNTGIAHYFEHMMFKGTDKIGTIDYAAEKVFLDSIARKYDDLRQTKDKKRRMFIQYEINRLSVKAAEYVIPNEFDKLVSKYGGSKINAGTSYDYTVYYNTFSPQYIAQWVEINSERLLNPIFRMFQSELETVYEEKNMTGDYIGGQAIEKLTERYFYPHPYAYPIIGSTENLKNPRLSEMRKFFEEYYVASNMGLILSGDFDTATTLPLLEGTFSRIPQGEAPRSVIAPPPPFKGRERAVAKFPIPLIKAFAFGFRGVPSDHPDQAALNIAVGILNNTNGTGYLDKLTVERKVMTAMSINESLNDAGILAVFVVPQLVVQSYRNAEKLVWHEIERVKEGDFTEDTFNSLKLEQLRQHMTGLEDINSRSQVMIRLFSQGKSWNDYMKELDNISKLTKEDVMRVANKYFGANYLYVRKKTGKYKKEYLPKPNFAPIVPKHTDATSEYAKELEKLPVREVVPRFVDFEKDVKTIQLADKVTLYTKYNSVNDIFTLNFSYGVGCLERPLLSQLAIYLPYLGTDRYTYEEFRSHLQTLGSTLMFDVDDNNFTVKVSGFDKNFKETMEVVQDFFNHAKVDRERLRVLVDNAKVTEKAFFKSSNEVAAALFERVQYGDQSRYLRKLSLSDIKELTGEELLRLFAEVQRVECSVHYCGTLSELEVSERIKEYLPLEQITVSSRSPFYRTAIDYKKPMVFFYDMRDISQSIVYGYFLGGPFDEETRHASKLFSVYFGGGMSSIMFQEIREFRSYAYYTYGGFQLPPVRYKDQPVSFVSLLSTQNDKTVDAMIVLDSLLRHLPEQPDKIEAVKQSILNQISNGYPTLREISTRIAGYKRDGYANDPNKTLFNNLETLGIEDIVRFHQIYMQGSQPVYIVVGNSKRIDMKRLASFGTLVKMKRKEFYR